MITKCLMTVCEIVYDKINSYFLYVYFGILPVFKTILYEIN